MTMKLCAMLLLAMALGACESGSTTEGTSPAKTNANPSTSANPSPNVLQQEDFGRLLVWLDPDPERVGAIYERIRWRLIAILASRGCALAEELADETIDRVARRLCFRATERRQSRAVRTQIPVNCRPQTETEGLDSVARSFRLRLDGSNHSAGRCESLDR
ncbi:MAG TPA: hypothetical protein VHD88_03710 [Pyrinomonadaceae bacterium]|nr:hypothetical protein [Pyrinomonadaceae bacterium]